MGEMKWTMLKTWHSQLAWRLGRERRQVLCGKEGVCKLLQIQVARRTDKQMVPTQAGSLKSLNYHPQHPNYGPFPHALEDEGRGVLFARNIPNRWVGRSILYGSNREGSKESKLDTQPHSCKDTPQ